MTSSKIKQKKSIIFVDFNGVLSYKNFWWSLEGANHPDRDLLEKMNSFLFKERKDILKKWMIGEYTSEEIHCKLAEECDSDYETIWKIFVKDCAEIDVSQAILRELERYKSTHWIILSTDNMDSFDRFTLPAHKELNIFDKIDNSYTLRSLKKDKNGEYFSIRAKEFGIPLKSCFFIDNTQAVCDIFSNLGGKSICASGEKAVIDALRNAIH